MNYTFLLTLLIICGFSEVVLSKPEQGMKINYSSDSYSPTQDSFRTIDFFEKKLKGICTIKLYNPEGKLIAQDVVNAAHHRVFIRVKGLKAGVHTIEVINEGKIYWKKFEVMKEE